MNSVQYILKNRPLSRENLIAIKKLGRPMPDLDIKVTKLGKSREYNRYFKPEIYSKFSWICGCAETNKLYCFVCLAFGDSDGSNQWSSTGVTDLQHLQERAARHAHTAAHLNSMVEFNILGGVDILVQLDKGYLKVIEENNKKVDDYRDTLHSCIEFYTNSFRDGIEGRIEDDPKFSGVKKTLLAAMVQVCREKINSQIRRSNFVALILNAVSDKVTIIYRYVFEGKVYERFWGILKCNGDMVSVLENLNSLGINVNQLISHSYSGPSCVYKKVKELIGKKYLNAFYVHCYSQDRSAVLENAACCNDNLKNFFHDIRSLSELFCEAVLDKLTVPPLARHLFRDLRTEAIPLIVRRRLLYEQHLHRILFETVDARKEAARLLYIFRSKNFYDIVFIINEIFPCVTRFFCEVRSRKATDEKIEKNLVEVESNITSVIKYIDDMITPKRRREEESDSEDSSSGQPEDDSTTFDPKRQRVQEEKSFDHVDVKVECQGQEMTQIEVEDSKGEVKIEIQEENLEQIGPKLTVGAPVEVKPEYLDAVHQDVTIGGQEYVEQYPELLEEDYQPNIYVILKEYLKTLKNNFKENFAFKGYLSASALFRFDKFPKYCSKFPDNLFQRTMKAYPFLDGAKLKVELGVIYGRTDMRRSTILTMLTFMYRNELHTVFPETYKLLDVICTTPMFASECEREIDKSNKVKNILMKAGNDDDTEAVAIMAAENSLWMSIAGFQDKVFNICWNDRKDYKYM